MPSEPLWLPVEQIIEINRREVAETGEPFCVLSPSLLESAAFRPRNIWCYEREEDMAVLATALLFGIARNHPFEQGNKRTGLTAAVVFLRANGYALGVSDTDAFADLIVGVISNKEPEAKFADVIGKVLIEIPDE